MNEKKNGDGVCFHKGGITSLEETFLALGLYWVSLLPAPKAPSGFSKNLYLSSALIYKLQDEGIAHDYSLLCS